MLALIRFLAWCLQLQLVVSSLVRYLSKLCGFLALHVSHLGCGMQSAGAI